MRPLDYRVLIKTSEVDHADWNFKSVRDGLKLQRVSNSKIVSLIKRKYHTIILVILVTLLVLVELLHLGFLTKYPPAFIDEAWTGNIAWTLMQTGKNFDSIHSGPLDQVGSPWLVLPFITSLPFVISFSLLGLGLFQIRLVAFVFGILLLCAVILAGSINYSRITGFLAALFLSLSQPFLMSSHWGRQDIMVATIVVLAYALAIYAFEREKWWAHFLTGALLGFSLDIHENAGLFIPGLAIIYLLNYRSKFLHKRGTWLAATGGLLGIAYFWAYHILPSPSTYFALNSYFYSGIHKLPIQDLNLSNLLESIRGEIGRYHFYNFSLDFALLGASIVFLIIKPRKSDILLFAYVGSAFICFVLFQGSKADYYGIIIYPFLMLMVAEAMVRIFQSIQGTPVIQVFMGTLICFFVLNSAIHVARPLIQSREYDYNAITSHLRSVLPADARVMGSPTWWPDLANYNYQSYITLQYYYFYNGYTLTEGFEQFRPEYIIVDPFMNWHLFGESTSNSPLLNEPTFSRQEFDKFLALRGTEVLNLEDPWHGDIQVYKIRWDRVIK